MQCLALNQQDTPFAISSCRSPVPPRTRRSASGDPCGTSTLPATQYASHVPMPGDWPTPSARSRPVMPRMVLHRRAPGIACTCIGFAAPSAEYNHFNSPAPVKSSGVSLSSPSASSSGFERRAKKASNSPLLCFVHCLLFGPRRPGWYMGSAGVVVGSYASKSPLRCSAWTARTHTIHLKWSQNIFRQRKFHGTGECFPFLV